MRIKNKRAYSSFYRKHKDKLFAYVMRMTGEYYLSSDIMQESFTRYFEHYGDKTESVSLLYTIARNALFDHTRKQRRTTQLEEEQEDCSAGNQEQALIVREEYQRVLSAMQMLKKDERDILALAVSGVLSYRSIASIAGISEANVKVKVHRARLNLKKILNPGDE